MNIDRKLRLTAAFVGAGTRKDLAAAFRKINPLTAFDVDRADKWLQGRSTPRQFSVYEDWIRLIDLPMPADWIIDCDVDTFIDHMCSHHGRERAQLERRAAAFGKPSNSEDERGGTIAGRYVCYSHSWSPYFRGQLIRGVLSIEQENGPQRLTATYSEQLPTMPLKLKGPVTVSRRSVSISVSGGAEDVGLFFSLLPFSPPGSVLGGYMMGGTILGPDSQPSVTRMVLVRIKDDSTTNLESAYLEPGVTVPQDLERFGLRLHQPDIADEHLQRFLTRSVEGGADQVSREDFQRLVELFDRAWLGR